LVAGDDDSSRGSAPDERDGGQGRKPKLPWEQSRDSAFAVFLLFLLFLLLPGIIPYQRRPNVKVETLLPFGFQGRSAFFY
jgi:hypothetical protein